MKNITIKLILWTLICSSGIFTQVFGQNIKLSKVQLTPGISIAMPKDFVLMNDEMLAKKYFTPKKPTAMYTNSSGEVDLGVNITNTYWQAQDIALLKDLFKGSLRANYTKVEFLKEEVVTINKRKYAVLEFLGIVADDDEKANALGRKNTVSKYNYMMYTVVENKVIVVNFNCPRKYQQEWAMIVPQIMQTIKIKNLKLNEPKKP